MVLQRNQWNVSVILVGRASHEPPAPQGGRNPNAQTSLKRVNLDKKNPKSNSLTIARHLPDEIRKLLVIKEANLERGKQPAIVGELNLDFASTENCGFSEV